MDRTPEDSNEARRLPQHSDDCKPAGHQVAREKTDDVDDVTAHAARTIQRSYRGYRARRELQGLGLNASARWDDVIKEAEWHVLHRPPGPDDSPEGNSSNQARRNWKRAVSVAKHAGGDDPEPSLPSTTPNDKQPSPSRESESSASSPSTSRNSHGHDLPPGTSAKMMDLQYFLEMVDLKHRHGSNLRVYHNHWKNSPSTQNFFYWLDCGEGKDLELPRCPRDRLEREQVRYLSREERMNYLTTVDEVGRFRWAKNNERVWTDSGRFKDSLKGVVPVEERAPGFKGNSENGELIVSRASSSASISSMSSVSDSEDDDRSDPVRQYEKDDYQTAKVAKKLVHASPAVIFNHLMGKSSTKKQDMWIFVADTSFRLYIGIKESGAFQHSSFLRGARIAAAGLIKIKDGQLRSLAPLSGHYRPPAANFRAFIHALQDQGVDMSHVSVSKSYAVLAGIEGYTKTKRKVRALNEKVEGSKQKIKHSLGSEPGAKQGDDGASKGGKAPQEDPKINQDDDFKFKLPFRSKSNPNSSNHPPLKPVDRFNTSGGGV